jgi:hypothetical protein
MMFRYAQGPSASGATETLSDRIHSVKSKLTILYNSCLEGKYEEGNFK